MESDIYLALRIIGLRNYAKAYDIIKEAKSKADLPQAAIFDQVLEIKLEKLREIREQR